MTEPLNLKPGVISEELYNDNSYYHLMHRYLWGPWNYYYDGIDRFTEILRYGLVSPNFARRVGIKPYRRIWQDIDESQYSFDKGKYIYIFPTAKAVQDSMRVIDPNGKHETRIMIVTDRHFAIKKPEDMPEGWKILNGKNIDDGSEIYRAHRISPKHFKAIAFNDMAPFVEQSKLVNGFYRDVTVPNITFNQLSAILTDSHERYGTRLLPIYGFSGKLYSS